LEIRIKQQLTYIGRSRIMRAKCRNAKNVKQEESNVRTAEKGSL